jgi:hypothetical protein
MVGERYGLSRVDPASAGDCGGPRDRGRHTGVAAYMTLCTAYGRMVRLTAAQAVIAEAERMALDVITCGSCVPAGLFLCAHGSKPRRAGRGLARRRCTVCAANTPGAAYQAQLWSQDASG